MVKIKLECWWTDSTSLHHRFIKQFVPSHELKFYEFVLEKPDCTIIFGKTNWGNILTPKERTFYISQEPLWSPNQPKHGIDQYCSKILISDKREYPNNDEYIECLLPMFYGGRGDLDSRDEWDWSQTIKDKKYNKDKIMSIIVRNDYFSHYNHLVNPDTSSINYEFRSNLGVSLSNNELIDIYGNNWISNGNNIKGEIWNKHIGLDDYHFSIGCENTIQKNYISEKFWDIVLTDGIPIYLGCSNITDYIPENQFISLNKLNIDDISKKITDIIDNYGDYVNLYSDSIKSLKDEFFNSSQFNLWEKIKNLIK